jgi:hypothetical protein
MLRFSFPVEGVCSDLRATWSGQMKSSGVPASELMAEILSLLGPLGAMSEGEAAALVELNETYLAGRERVGLDTLVVVVEQLADFLEANGTHTEGVFRLSAPLSQLDALSILVVLRPELVTQDVLLRASAVTVAGVLKRMLSATAKPVLTVCENPVEAITDLWARKVLHRLVLLIKVLRNAPGTKMSESSFAVCLAPTLFGPDVLSSCDKDPQQAALLAQQMNRLFGDIVKRKDEFFPHPYVREQVTLFPMAGGSATSPRTHALTATGGPQPLSFQVVGTIPVADHKGAFNVIIIQVRSERGCFVLLRRYRQIFALHERLNAVYGETTLPEFPGKTIGGASMMSEEKVRRRIEKLRVWFAGVAQLDNVIHLPEMIHFLTSSSSATSEMDEALPSAPFAGGLVGKDKCPVCRHAFDTRAELLSHLQFSDCKMGHPVPVSDPNSSPPPAIVASVSKDGSPRSRSSKMLKKLISPRRTSEKELSASPRGSAASPKTSPRTASRPNTPISFSATSGGAAAFPGIPMKLIDESVSGGAAQTAAAQAVISMGAMSLDDSGSIGSNESSPRKSQGSPHQSSQRISPRGNTSPHLPSAVSAESPRNTSRGLPRAAKKSGQL